jgi:hypothetical protein
MYRATRELIKARQPYTKYVLEHVFVKQVGGGLANQCFQNATDESLLAKGNKVVSGWVVNAYDSERGSTAIVQHWWNIDANGSYFDTTPDVDVALEYVVDSGISEYGQDHFDELKNLVAISLLFQNGDFWGVESVDGKLISKSLLSLATENLFQTN